MTYHKTESSKVFMFVIVSDRLLSDSKRLYMEKLRSTSADVIRALQNDTMWLGEYVWASAEWL